MVSAVVAEIEYTNWKGETRLRRVIPVKIRLGETQWHPGEQWLLDAHDVEKGEARTFALKDVQSWARVEVEL